MVGLQQIQRLEIMVTKLVEELKETRKQSHELKLRIEELENINRESDSNAQKVEVGIQGVMDIIDSMENGEMDDSSPSAASAPGLEKGNSENQDNSGPKTASYPSESDENVQATETEKGETRNHTTSEDGDSDQSDETLDSVNKDSSLNQPEKNEKSLSFSHPDDMPEEVDLDETYPESEEQKSELDLF